MSFRFALADFALSAIPDLDSVPAAVPSFVDETNHRTYLFSPTDFGLAAPVTWGPLDAIFMLDVNMGGDTRIASARRSVVLEALVSECVAWRPAGGEWMAALTAAVARAATYRLFLGDIGEAGRLVAARVAQRRAMEVVSV